MNTSISPPVAATPVAEVPVTLPIGDAGFLSLKAEFVAVSLAWFAVLGATALGGLL